MTLPTFLCSSSRRCAFAASANRNTLSISGPITFKLSGTIHRSLKRRVKTPPFSGAM